MSNNKAAEIFKKLSCIPSLKKALFEKVPSSKNYKRITATWSQRNLMKNEMTSFTNQFVICGDSVDVTAPVTFENVLWRVRSRSGQKTFLLKQSKDKDKPSEVKQYIEIWNEMCMTHNVPVSTLKSHGLLYDDDEEFGSVAWSNDGEKILFIAEKVVAKGRKYFSTETEGVEGTTYLYRGDWGEQMSKKVEPVLCVFEPATFTSYVVDWLPTSCSYGQHKPDMLMWLECNEGGPHHQEHRVVVRDLPLSQNKVLQLKASNWGWDLFVGFLEFFCWELELFCCFCWCQDKFLGIFRGSSMKWIDDERVLLSSISCSRLMIGRLPSAGSESEIAWRRLSQSEQNFVNDIAWTINEIKNTSVTNSKGVVDYEYILLEPTAKKKLQPLIVCNHGGPHSVFLASYNTQLAAYCLLGFSLLLTNYRGSLGYGEDNVESLPGNVGTQDVADIKLALDTVIARRQADPNKLAVIGGSHGGFLTLHLIGQYPDLFKVAVARNAVVNLTNMLGVSDIPDWVYTEVGEVFDDRMIVSPALLNKLLSKSPWQYVDKMKTPLLLMVGGADFRVPPSQSLQLFKSLKASNRTVRLHLYPESCHPLAEVDVEVDNFINGVMWIEEHLNG
ncbi:hypothetical protein HELRODRAFT_193470 [Helobdella robusta]|uniref:acylaminoacyl-peptidase n=1 Tax=Helobdella robusta TaxID=6412 RepID=T1FV12_HELRO|nr:hypothetical protein HELRODRAFT_193470 [Helobdella robusta]ESN95758.1 hypothetical protein HELRODRAFT_193470 [Helobdella robusta]